MADRTKQNADTAPSQAAAPTGDAAEIGLRSIDAVTGMARHNMETMLSVAHSTVQGLQAMMTELTAFSRDSIERATHAAQAMTAVSAPNDLLKMQSEFARQQAEATMAEMTKLSHIMIKTARESLAVAMDGAKSRGDDR